MMLQSREGVSQLVIAFAFTIVFLVVVFLILTPPPPRNVGEERQGSDSNETNIQVSIF